MEETPRGDGRVDIPGKGRSSFRASTTGTPARSSTLPSISSNGPGKEEACGVPTRTHSSSCVVSLGAFPRSASAAKDLRRRLLCCRDFYPRPTYRGGAPALLRSMGWITSGTPGDSHAQVRRLDRPCGRDKRNVPDAHLAELFSHASTPKMNLATAQVGLSGQKLDFMPAARNIQAPLVDNEADLNLGGCPASPNGPMADEEIGRGRWAAIIDALRLGKRDCSDGSSFRRLLARKPEERLFTARL